ncbi:hypothetical protein TrVE_jg12489 [Triparma verrucosa]|uniref:Uncharacterized protein n=1 Tax=Triparma verrucosa TaxID=1606542 RepID=A0A9W7CE00_9STRA|nr:hypothetical protein TrVE_jg12489 [Triparma verrucosa]
MKSIAAQILLLLSLLGSSSPFYVPHLSGVGCSGRGHGSKDVHSSFATSLSVLSDSIEVPTSLRELDLKEKAKIFGRLADKYILLDESGGDCCYSGCKDCEYRDPDGSYRMAEMLAARPKWIVPYSRRSFGSASGLKDHSSRWLSTLFSETPSHTKSTFISAFMELEYQQPLGGPYLSVPEGTDISATSVESFADLIFQGKESMSVKQCERIIQGWKGGEGLVWNDWIKLIE